MCKVNLKKIWDYIQKREHLSFFWNFLYLTYTLYGYIVLKVTVPKKDEKKALPETRRIEIQ